MFCKRKSLHCSPGVHTSSALWGVLPGNVHTREGAWSSFLGTGLNLEDTDAVSDSASD